jgi:hypothetical protein
MAAQLMKIAGSSIPHDGYTLKIRAWDAVLVEWWLALGLNPHAICVLDLRASLVVNPPIDSIVCLKYLDVLEK